MRNWLSSAPHGPRPGHWAAQRRRRALPRGAGLGQAQGKTPHALGKGATFDPGNPWLHTAGEPQGSLGFTRVHAAGLPAATPSVLTHTSFGCGWDRLLGERPPTETCVINSLPSRC